VFALLALSVAQRTKEIGIRLAVGARGNDVMRLVLREGAWMVVGGTVGGLIAAQLLSGGLESLLFGLTPMDPVARVAAFTIVVAAGLAGACLPARRASRVNPMEALRDE